MSLPLAIAITVIVVIGVLLITYVEGQNLSYMHTEKVVDDMRSSKSREDANVHYQDGMLDVKNLQNNPIQIKYIRILDDNGNLIDRIPFNVRVGPFSNSTLNLTGVVPLQYLR